MFTETVVASLLEIDKSGKVESGRESKKNRIKIDLNITAETDKGYLKDDVSFR